MAGGAAMSGNLSEERPAAGWMDKGKVEMTVDFKNTPPGTTVKTETKAVDLFSTVGFAGAH
jgi:hypothetical protein